MTPTGQPRTAAISTTLTPENRITVPTPIRRQLGVQAGDRLVFITESDGSIRLTTAQALIQAVWANNHGGDGGDAGDAGTYVGEMRRKDQAQDDRPMLDEPIPAEQSQATLDALLQILEID